MYAHPFLGQSPQVQLQVWNSSSTEAGSHRVLLLSDMLIRSRGKAYIHSAGRTTDQNNLWNDLPPQNDFLAAMADAASAVHKKFKGRIAYISLLVNLSVDCDCCAVAEDPCLKDIGILASDDPVALDQACVDLVNNSKDVGRDHFMERVNSRHGTYILEVASKEGYGSREYELIDID